MNVPVRKQTNVMQQQVALTQTARFNVVVVKATAETVSSAQVWYWKLIKEHIWVYFYPTPGEDPVFQIIFHNLTFGRTS